MAHQRHQSKTRCQRMVVGVWLLACWAGGAVAQDTPPDDIFDDPAVGSEIPPPAPLTDDDPADDDPTAEGPLPSDVPPPKARPAPSRNTSPGETRDARPPRGERADGRRRAERDDNAYQAGFAAGREHALAESRTFELTVGCAVGFLAPWPITLGSAGVLAFAPDVLTVTVPETSRSRRDRAYKDGYAEGYKQATYDERKFYGLSGLAAGSCGQVVIAVVVPAVLSVAMVAVSLAPLFFLGWSQPPFWALPPSTANPLDVFAQTPMAVPLWARPPSE